MERRAFVGTLGAAAVGAMIGPDRRAPLPSSGPGPDGGEWRRHFPALAQEVNGHPLVYLDTAATSLRPTPVIEAIADFYRRDNANPGGTLHTLARRANEEYEGARRTIARFINAADPSEVVFTRGTTDAINLAAAAWGSANLGPGDEILIGVAEHASNMVPWQMAARRTGATVRYFPLDEAGRPSEPELLGRLTPRTRLVAFSHVSNVLGLINPAARLIASVRAMQPRAAILVDAAQSVPHLPVDVRALDCDFLAFSSHKMCGPMGVGVLWARRALLDAMPPYQGGSNMAHEVDLDGLALSEGALKFGAGTPNASGAIGLAAAVRFLEGLGWAAIRAHEVEITRHLLARLSAIRGVRLVGPASTEERIGLCAFNIEGRAPGEVLAALDARGIAVRAGDLAALPLLKQFGVTRAVRASAYLYTTPGEIDALADAVAEIARAT